MRAFRGNLSDRTDARACEFSVLPGEACILVNVAHTDACAGYIHTIRERLVDHWDHQSNGDALSLSLSLLNVSECTRERPQELFLAMLERIRRRYRFAVVSSVGFSLKIYRK
jgi:hypothetical protein